MYKGARGGVVVKALRYKPAGRGFDSRWCHWNFVLRRVFGPKRDEVTGELRKLHNEDLSDLYSLPNIVRVVNREE